ncbi:MAG TPA: hypothetical protein VJ719_06725 [Chthoniobacterales bacterium]|nr:hypothetical protein [Chthoniobacterales bacterium]
MKVLSDFGPRPRLLESAVTAPEAQRSDGIPVSKPEQFGKRFFRTVVRLVVVAALAFAVAYWFVHRDLIHEESAAIRRLIRVGTHRLSAEGRHGSKPDPIVVRLTEDLVQVSTIALGHPRLAVINGKQVAEGDTVTVHTPIRSVAITLRVIDIADNEVKLSDGAQIITAHLSRAPGK